MLATAAVAILIAIGIHSAFLILAGLVYAVFTALAILISTVKPLARFTMIVTMFLITLLAGIEGRTPDSIWGGIFLFMGPFIFAFFSMYGYQICRNGVLSTDPESSLRPLTSNDLSYGRTQR